MQLLAMLRSSVLLLLVTSAAADGAAAQTPAPSSELGNMDAVVHELCNKQIALLGENPIHGFGKTLEFKVALVQRLVNECHYNALFIESGMYDYVHMDEQLKSGQDVSDETISAAIGGLWANKEVQALVPFLREKVKAGSLTLGGLDDQLGAGTWAQHEMPAYLVRHLSEEEQARCLGVLRKHMLWQYTADAPYGPSDKANIVGCLNEIAAQLASPPQRSEPHAAEDKAMVASLERNFARNFTEDDFSRTSQQVEWFDDRDRSMYLNFDWLFHRLPPDSKVIVWAATVHVARGLSNASGFEGRVPFGAYVSREFGDQAFALGFSAYAGEYAFTHQPTRTLSAAPGSSLEAQGFVHFRQDTVYLSRENLRSDCGLASRALDIDFTSAHWDQLLDGLIIFRTERAPVWIKY